MINLITSFFIPKEVERQNEILKCLKNNINSRYIKKIYLCIEKKEDLDFLKEKINPKGKIQLILFNKQPTYADYVKIANQLQEEICMISNSDIWVRNCEQELINLLKNNNNICYSLTRYERDKNNNIKLLMTGWNDTNYSVGSFDSFIFKSPIQLDYSLINQVQNRPGSEHVFKTELEYKGIKFYNPCYDIITVHEHLSNIRTYTKKDDLLWEYDSSDNYAIFKYSKSLTPTPPQKKLTIMREYSIEKNYRKKTYSTVSSLFSR